MCEAVFQRDGLLSRLEEPAAPCSYHRLTISSKKRKSRTRHNK